MICTIAAETCRGLHVTSSSTVIDGPVFLHSEVAKSCTFTLTNSSACLLQCLEMAGMRYKVLHKNQDINARIISKNHCTDSVYHGMYYYSLLHTERKGLLAKEAVSVNIALYRILPDGVTLGILQEYL